MSPSSAGFSQFCIFSAGIYPRAGVATAAIAFSARASS
jgi:hypothetical protein